MNKKNAS
jgi:hypothetical protein